MNLPASLWWWLLPMAVACHCGPVCAQVADDEPWTWDERRFGGIVTQELDRSCGLAALLTIMQTHFGDQRHDERSLLAHYITRASEAELLEAMRNGLSLLEIDQLAQSLGYVTNKRLLNLGELERLVSFVPVLVYLEVGSLRHFAVVRGVDARRVLLADPSRGHVEYGHEDFLAEWKSQAPASAHAGAALIVVRREGPFAQQLLNQPEAGSPPAFVELRRQLTFLSAQVNHRLSMKVPRR